MLVKSIWQIFAFISGVLLALISIRGASSDDLLGFISGNKLLAMCQSPSDLEKTSCVGYVTGFVDSASKFSSLGNTCYFQTPKGVTQNQLVDITVKYLTNHPEERHWLAVTPMMEGMKEAFPCPI